MMQNDGVTGPGAWRPRVFRAADEEDRRALRDLLAREPWTQSFDTLEHQLADLWRTRHPKQKVRPHEIAARAAEVVPPSERDGYGVWVHYAWSNRLVRLLDRADFIELRTNRNRYKLTQAEQDLLATRKVGVIGLSVGQSAAVTMALERSFGEIRLADFDQIDLSNLNRIRAGLHTVGVPKVHVTAREIAEIDPFLEVRCFLDGLTEENIEAFFLEGGKLDVAVEECDSIEIKILVREFARAHRVPVVMDTSDRGLMDVERFDLEPDRPILHGLAEGFELAKLKGLSNEDKVPYVLKIIGADTISTRMKATLPEVEQSVVTWPQLASAVVHGGGAAADVVRRILLGEPARSGRFFVDLGELIGGECGIDRDRRPPIELPATPSWADEVRAASAGAPAAEGAGVDRGTIERLVQSAVLAPSGANCQPWQWVLHEGRLHLFHDRKRSFSLTDFQGMGGVVALGCALENLVLAAHAEGLHVRVEPFPSASQPDLAARVTVSRNETSGAEIRTFTELAARIGERCTNRKLGPRRSLPPAAKAAITEAVLSVRGARLLLLEDGESLDRIGELIGAGDRLRFLDAALNQELMREIRWSREESDRTGDGLLVDTLELSPTDRAGMEICRDYPAMELVQRWGGGAALEKPAKKAIASASAVALITMPSTTQLDYLMGGRAVERGWLAATQHDVACYPMTALPYFFARMIRGGGEGLSPFVVDELRRLRSRYTALFEVTDGEAEVLLTRFSLADAPSARASRRPLGESFTVVG